MTEREVLYLLLCFLQPGTQDCNLPYLLYHIVHLLGPTSVTSDTCLCLIRVRGVYPTLTVTDIQGEGTATTYSKMRLWSMLGIDRCAKCLVFVCVYVCLCVCMYMYIRTFA